MPHFKFNIRDILFILNEQLDYGSLCVLPRYQGGEIADMPEAAF